jgi:hypothetical protein
VFLNVNENQRQLAILQPVSFSLSDIVHPKIKQAPEFSDLFLIDYTTPKQLKELAVKVVMMRIDKSQRR